MFLCERRIREETTCLACMNSNSICILLAGNYVFPPHWTPKKTEFWESLVGMLHCKSPEIYEAIASRITQNPFARLKELSNTPFHVLLGQKSFPFLTIFTHFFIHASATVVPLRLSSPWSENMLKQLMKITASVSLPWQAWELITWKMFFGITAGVPRIVKICYKENWKCYHTRNGKRTVDASLPH